jgi:hypothetical protein
MTVLTVVAMPPEDDGDLIGKYDYSRLPEEIRIKAMTAEGTVVQGLRSAVQRVLEAGQVLMWAKETLPHGEYLPWVQEACGLKPDHAAKLIKASQWMSNMGHGPHLEGITDTRTLFLLSTDTTPEEVREWFMERCVAGNVPTRKEVQERKRGSSENARQRGLIEETISALKLRPEALCLAAQAQHISTRQLLQELDADELPKGRKHETPTATYCKNGTGWWKLPIQQPVDVEPSTPTTITADEPKTLRLAEAAALLGKKLPTLRVGLSPSKMKRSGYPTGNGWQAEPAPGRGMCLVRRLPL